MKTRHRLESAALLAPLAAASAIWACGVSPSLGSEASASAPASPPAAAASAQRRDYSVSISGLVEQPMCLTRADLMSYQSVTVRLNDVRRDGSFRGVFTLRGVPLRTLLEMARIRKESSVFGREMDLAIAVRGASGEVALLSWGEVFYRNAAEVVLAYDSSGILPSRDCASCHAPEVYEPWRSQILRRVPYPKLVVTKDHFSDRSVEEVTSVEVVELGVDEGFQVAKEDAPEVLRADVVEAESAAGETVELSRLDGLGRREVEVIQAGEGTGFHGVRRYEGVPLKEVLEELGWGPDPSSAFLLSARDGYRVLMSNGEIFSSTSGEDVLLADALNGTPLTDTGRFQLVPLADQSADRWLKGVATLDRVEYRP